MEIGLQLRVPEDSFLLAVDSMMNGTTRRSGSEIYKNITVHYKKMVRIYRYFKVKHR